MFKGEREGMREEGDGEGREGGWKEVYCSPQLFPTVDCSGFSET